MLNALYQYAVEQQLALPVGFVLKTVKAFLCLTADGRFLGLELSDDRAYAAPDIGSLANGTNRASIFSRFWRRVPAPFPLWAHASRRCAARKRWTPCTANWSARKSSRETELPFAWMEHAFWRFPALWRGGRNTGGDSLRRETARRALA